MAWILEFGQGVRDLSPPDPDSEQGREWNEGRSDRMDQGSYDELMMTTLTDRRSMAPRALQVFD